MKQLQKIWGEASFDTPLPDDIKQVFDKKHVSEVGRFKSVMKIELIVSWIAMALLLIFHDLVPRNVFFFVSTVIVVASIVNIWAIVRLRDIIILHDTKSFLENSVKVIKRFVFVFIFSALLICLIVIVLLWHFSSASVNFSSWLMSKEGLSVLLVISSILSTLIFYARMVYYPRIRNLNILISEMNGR